MLIQQTYLEELFCFFWRRKNILAIAYVKYYNYNTIKIGTTSLNYSFNDEKV